MSKMKKCKVVMLPTNEKAIYDNNNANIIGLHKNNYLQFCKGFDKEIEKKFKPQNLYILSDEEIKESDWYWHELQPKSLFKAERNPFKYASESTKKQCKKIIATTDASLSPRLHVGEIVDESYPKEFRSSILPQPSQSFIQTYIEEYNKGNIITEALVEYENFSFNVIGVDRPKVNLKDNTITIKKVKEIWNREEHIADLFKVWVHLRLHFRSADMKTIKQEFDQWTAKNL